MKRLTLLCLVPFVLAVAAPAAFALQERTITDEPSVNKSQAPASTEAAPAQAAPAQGAPAQTPAAKTPTPAGQTTGNPAEKAFSKSSAKPKEAAPAQADQWTPPASGAPADQFQDTPPASAGSGGDIYHSPEATQVQTYSRKEIDQQVMGFFEGGARGLAEVIGKAFDRYGEPVGFIKGGEGAGALFVGLRYGEGWLHLKNGQKVYVYWQSPSLGFDLGANISKVFCLVYGMTSIEQIFQRYPGVDGSAYVVGGFGMNYQRSDPVTLAPIRFGVGLRLGANVGYMHFTREKTINPF